MLTPDQIDALPTWTATQHRKYWEHIEHQIAELGAAVQGSGRSFTRADLQAVHQNVLFWQQRETEEQNQQTGGGIALVRFGEAQ
jgi:hypothetical protein